MINSVCIAGNLAADCAKLGSKENPVVAFTIAWNESVKKGDSWEKVAHFFDCVMFGNYAKAVSDSLTKGTPVVVQGQLKEHNTEKDGKKYYNKQIVVRELSIMARGTDEPVPFEKW